MEDVGQSMDDLGGEPGTSWSVGARADRATLASRRRGLGASAEDATRVGVVTSHPSVGEAEDRDAYGQDRDVATTYAGPAPCR